MTGRSIIRSGAAFALLLYMSVVPGVAQQTAPEPSSGIASNAPANAKPIEPIVPPIQRILPPPPKLDSRLTVRSAVKGKPQLAAPLKTATPKAKTLPRTTAITKDKASAVAKAVTELKPTAASPPKAALKSSKATTSPAQTQ